MTKRSLRKILKWSGWTLAGLVLVLAVHIYLVTRHRPPDEHTVVMARIDVKQPMNNDQAVAMTNWLYGQKGVNHVLANGASKNIVFTYYPVQVSGDQVVEKFERTFRAGAVRYKPSAEEMRSGCPAMAQGSGNVYRFVKNLF